MRRHQVVLRFDIRNQLPQLVVEDIEVVDLAKEHVEDGLWIVLLCKMSSCSLSIDIFDNSVTRVQITLEPKMFGEVLNTLSVIYCHQLRQENVLIKLLLLQGLPQPNRYFIILSWLKRQQLG